MHAYAYRDRELERHAGRFVWLSIDAEKRRNAGFLEKYPISAYPTLLVLDARKERVLATWIGGATATQVVGLLDDGERAMRGKGRGPDALVARGDRSLGAGKPRKAASNYRKALAQAPLGWPQHGRVVESLLMALALAGENQECVDRARSEPTDEVTRHRAAVLTLALDCALGLDGDGAADAVRFFEEAGRSIVTVTDIDWPADERSGLYRLLVAARREAGDDEGAESAAREWLAFLERQAAEASDPAARTVFDAHRLSAALAAGEPMLSVPALLQSESDFPDDYNPPSRLALAYLESGRFEEARAAVERALQRVDGPRRLRVLSQKADVCERMGDVAAARAALEEAIRYAEGLPRAQVSRRRIEHLRELLARGQVSF